MPLFVGRSEPLSRLTAVYRASTPRVAALRPGLALVTGEAGIGKTALLNRFADDVAGQGATVGWGGCWDGDQAPAWWPWTQALRALLDADAGLRDAAEPELAAVVPEVAGWTAPATGSSGADRLQVFDAVGRLLARAAGSAPVVVILDDLHWADSSTVDLLRFLAHGAQACGVVLVGAYRPHEPRPEVAGALADLATAAELVALQGLPPDEVDDLVRTIAGDAAATRWARPVYERSAGHPFFARELCHLLAGGGSADAVPTAVRGAVDRRLARLPQPCVTLLEAVAVAGTAVSPDVLAQVCGESLTTVGDLVALATDAGVLVASGPSGTAAFAHDLYRETVYSTLAPARRTDLHHRIAIALLHRGERGSPVFATELARHFAAAVAVAGSHHALEWARAAADADRERFAFTEAAGHLARARTAITDAGLRLTTGELVRSLTAEADLRLRSGDAGTARSLLDDAWARAVPTMEPDLLAAVALGLDRVGARFGMPRTELIAVLEAARAALADRGDAAEAEVTAALARQLQHSVPAERPRARPLAERAVAIARTLDDPATLASCLLAQHDALWTPGTAADRVAVAADMADLARRAGDPERYAQALLLSASAQLESGSAAFRATAAQYRHAAEQLRQPRHTYVLRTREAALALIDGDVELGERLSVEAAAFGEAIGDNDAGNVLMSQRLEVIRVRADPVQLRETADAAVRWWIGVPAHAHAVAAGFRARAGDLDAARREVDTVLALPDWRTDRSYLWSVFVGELVAAATALDDRVLCERLLEDLLPVAHTCVVNGALVCFMGAHAHRVGLLYAALNQQELAGHWLERALDIHRRLGARLWQDESRAALERLPGRPGRPPTHEGLHLIGDMWQASFGGRTVYLPDAKGLHDLAALLAAPGVEVPALRLLDNAGSAPTTAPTPSEPVLDRAALAAYRRRLAELDNELDDARTMTDAARLRRATDEREYLLAELRRATRPGGRSRTLGSTTAERARKAVTARIRDAIRRITKVHPDFGRHLDRTVRTGANCRYDPGIEPRGDGLRRGQA
ncbi:ATP-binding protein [Virgisporangium aliadipatigenens]|uniref:ATP-binding protein n=1 Tax=Virgisporangium aliadipatigenens TaxID=741659 RepID=UPI001941210A|nr:AAA family ATPase [Virgisporangium aliadipatigenens]